MAMDEIIEAFVQESNELLVRMEELLLALENDPHNNESLNGIFRSVHTIKGSAGMFGFDWIVEFSHVLENLLEYMRSGKLESDSQLIESLLLSKDYLQQIVHDQSYNNKVSDKKIAEGRVILSRLEPYLSKINISKQNNSENTNPTHDPRTIAETQNAYQGRSTGDSNQFESSGKNSLKINLQNTNYHISLRLNENVFINALDPMSFLKYLDTVGKTEFVRVILSEMPEWEDFNPELCKLGFEINLKSDSSMDEVRKIFEFLEYDSTVAILPPRSEMQNLKSHIESLPEDEIFLGNLYKEMGTITNEELIHLLELFQGITQSEIIPSIKTETKQDSDVSSKKQPVISSTLRVDSSRIDYLINKVGELVVSEANLSQILQNQEDTIIHESLYSVSRLIHEIREISLKLRMVPIGESFNKYHRIVRDLGNELSKKVLLHIKGGDTELDKTVMEKLSDPMVHIVRNAIDHGLETPQERISSGKPEEGNLTLNAYHDTGSIIIEISDDGRGIDHDKVLKKAIEKGIVPDGQTLPKDEIESLLFHPGFSTADKVSNISGRGVGLDVVQKNIESLRGFISINSEKNKGTKFIIRLPLTLAIIDGFLVGSGPDLYVIPLDMVRECVEFRENHKTSDQTGSFFNLRGNILPFIRLDEFFHNETNIQPRENIVITEFQGKKFGLVVDNLYGEIQTVIKPLAKVFQNIRGIGGSTTLGDGRIALILDVADIHFFLKERQV